MLPVGNAGKGCAGGKTANREAAGQQGKIQAHISTVARRHCVNRAGLRSNAAHVQRASRSAALPIHYLRLRRRHGDSGRTPVARMRTSPALAVRINGFPLRGVGGVPLPRNRQASALTKVTLVLETVPCLHSLLD